MLSRLEYDAIVWYPIYTCHTIKLEHVHRKMLKYLSYCMDGVDPTAGSSHPELPARQGMVSLSQ